VAQHWWWYGLSLVKRNIAIRWWCHAGNVRCEGGWSVMVGAWVLALIPWLSIFSTIRPLHFDMFQKCYKLNIEVLYLLGSKHSVGWRQNQEHTNLCDSCHKVLLIFVVKFWWLWWLNILSWKWYKPGKNIMPGHEGLFINKRGANLW